MGKINKDLNVYDNRGNFITTGDKFVGKGTTPVSHKYPGGSTLFGYTTAKGKHIGSHKPIKNHRGKTIKRS